MTYDQRNNYEGAISGIKRINFDFEYKNNCILTIDDYRHKGLFELSDLLEVLDDNGTICTITFDELEKLVLGYEE